MKTTQFHLITALVAITSTLTLLPTSARAQNPGYAPGDLVIFFQNPGGSQGSDMQLFATTGNTATVFRQAFVNGQNLTNVVNVGGLLGTTFSTNWTSETTLYGGLGGTWSASTGTSLSNGDPGRTVYTSMPRNVVGTPGVAASSVAVLAGNTAMTATANAVIQQNNIFETLATNSPAAITNGLGSTIQSINPTDAFGGGNSWNNNIPAPGVQQQGSASSFGTFGPFTNVEFLWDVYRVQARKDVSGQYGFGEPIREGMFLGTVVLDASGNVSFVAAAGTSTPYDAWAASYGLDPSLTTGATAGDRTANPDGDSLLNFAEFAFGTNPTIGSPAPISATRNGGNVLVTMIQRNTDITSYVLQTRGELGSGSWTNSGLSPTAAGDQAGVPSGYTRVVYTAAGGPGKVFFRALATE